MAQAHFQPWFLVNCHFLSKIKDKINSGLFTKFNIVFFEKFMNPLNITIWILSLLSGILTLFFIFRIILTWYPQVNLNSFPFKLIALPTEIFLIPTRKIVPPIGGVDISPIIWVGILSLLREILIGQQGLLRMALVN